MLASGCLGYLFGEPSGGVRRSGKKCRAPFKVKSSHFWKKLNEYMSHFDKGTAKTLMYFVGRDEVTREYKRGTELPGAAVLARFAMRD